ncbi:MAG: hypothetical protein V4726_15330, partial [Verrucomicrobiota bacterium]
MSYPIYSEFKIIGVEWIGSLPASWSMKRLRFLVSAIDQGWSPRASNTVAEGDEMGVLKRPCKCYSVKVAVRLGVFE